MIEERERFEVLMEEMRDNFRILAEGQNALRDDIKLLDKKVEHVHLSLKNEMKFTYMALNEKIEDHIKQPSHSA